MTVPPVLAPDIRNFLHDLALQVAGPIVAALLGSLVVGAFLQRAARRAEDGRADRVLRHEMVDQMVTTASALYVQTQLYWRERMGGISWGKDIAALRRQLDEQYVKSQVDGLMLESRLGVYFALPDAKRKWHRTMDLLTVRYFQVLEADSGRDRAARLRRLYDENEGEDHSGLNAADLNNAEKVLDGYRDALQQATHAVMTGQRELGRRLWHRRGNRAIRRELHVPHQVEDTAAPQ